MMMFGLRALSPAWTCRGIQMRVAITMTMRIGGSFHRKRDGESIARDGRDCKQNRRRAKPQASASAIIARLRFRGRTSSAAGANLPGLSTIADLSLLAKYRHIKIVFRSITRSVM